MNDLYVLCNTSTMYLPGSTLHLQWDQLIQKHDLYHPLALQSLFYTPFPPSCHTHVTSHLFLSHPLPHILLLLQLKAAESVLAAQTAAAASGEGTSTQLDTSAIEELKRAFELVEVSSPGISDQLLRRIFTHLQHRLGNRQYKPEVDKKKTVGIHNRLWRVSEAIIAVATSDSWSLTRTATSPFWSLQLVPVVLIPPVYSSCLSYGRQVSFHQLEVLVH